MNWESIITAIITSVPPTIVAAAAYIQAKRTHQAVNSRMTELLLLARQEAGAQATLDEKAAQHVRTGEAAVTAAKIESLTQPKGETS